jgi:hypothetical protein
MVSTAAHAEPTSPAPPQPVAAAPAPLKCDRPENRQFDFWAGLWTVVNTKTGAPEGESLIEPIYGGCTLRENWCESGYSGGSLNTYDRISGQWRQTWTDASGAWREFTGGLVDGKMVLVWRHPNLKAPGKTAQERMTFTHNPNGTVRQYMDLSPDGESWSEGYDYTYKPVAKDARPAGCDR